LTNYHQREPRKERLSLSNFLPKKPGFIQVTTPSSSATYSPASSFYSHGRFSLGTVYGIELGLVSMILFIQTPKGLLAQYFQVIVEDPSSKLLAPVSPYSPLTPESITDFTVIPGEPPERPKREEVTKTIGGYRVPTRLRDLYKGKNFSQIFGSDTTRKENTHPFALSKLLFIEELRMEEDIQYYNLENVKLQVTPGGRVLKLRVPGLEEKRPSVLYEDRVFVRYLKSTSNRTEFEGYVHQVEKDFLHLGFDKIFTQSYSSLPEPVNVRFGFSRTPPRHCHYAIQLASERLVSAVLFPKESSSS
jgi:helicase MOV-10